MTRAPAILLAFLACATAMAGAITPGFVKVSASSPDSTGLLVTFREEGLSPGKVTEIVSASATFRGQSGKDETQALSVRRTFLVSNAGVVEVSVPLQWVPNTRSGKITFSNIRVEDATNGLDEDWDGTLFKTFTAYELRAKHSKRTHRSGSNRIRAKA